MRKIPTKRQQTHIQPIKAFDNGIHIAKVEHPADLHALFLNPVNRFPKVNRDFFHPLPLFSHSDKVEVGCAKRLNPVREMKVSDKYIEFLWDDLFARGYTVQCRY